MKTKVILSDTTSGIAQAVAECFNLLGGKGLLKTSGDVFIKVNAVDLKQYCYTDPQVLRETILYFKNAGAKNIYVMENCTQGNFTRLVFHATGYRSICRETGAIPVYLDETKSVPVFLNGIEEFIDISSFVYDKLVLHRAENLYLSLPKLKTHSMSQVTLSIKNQFGFVHQQSRIADHNFKIHQKFADIYEILKPDVSLVDGIIATNHGHYIAVNNSDRCVVPFNLLIAGRDPLAVDTVSSALMGYAVKDVKHLALAAKKGIGVSDPGKIDIINRKLFNERRKKLTHELLDDFPPTVKILRGKKRCCKEGCRRNTETVLEVLYRDYAGKGGFTILMGSGISEKEIGKINGPVHIAGSCAVQEHGMELVNRLGKKNVTMSEGCNNLASTLNGLCRQTGVHPLRLVPVNPLLSLVLLIIARARGSRANIPPLF